jgi:hypothetical protein
MTLTTDGLIDSGGHDRPVGCATVDVPTGTSLPTPLTCPALTGGVFPTIFQRYRTQATVTRREPHLSAEQRRALEILAARVRGCTGAALLDHGFCTGMLADLVRDGLATTRLESLRTGNRKIAVARVRITDAGQMALERAADIRVMGGGGCARKIGPATCRAKRGEVAPSQERTAMLPV